MALDREFKEGTKVKSSDGKHTGVLTGGMRDCNMEGCTGLRLTVKWKDGSITMPCTKGMVYYPKKRWWKIGH